MLEGIRILFISLGNARKSFPYKVFAVAASTISTEIFLKV